MKRFHIAQVNIGRVRAALDDEIMHGFTSRLDEINALADTSSASSHAARTYRLRRFATRASNSAW